MARLLFTIKDSFHIKGRGLILTPGISTDTDDRLKVGDPIMLKRPNGSSMLWEIGAFEMFGRPHLSNPIQLKVLDKEDVPIGTEIWTVDEMPMYPAELVFAETAEIVREHKNRFRNEP